MSSGSDTNVDYQKAAVAWKTALEAERQALAKDALKAEFRRSRDKYITAVELTERVCDSALDNLGNTEDSYRAACKADEEVVYGAPIKTEAVQKASAACDAAVAAVEAARDAYEAAVAAYDAACALYGL